MVARVLVAAALAACALAACKRTSEKWCELHPNDLEYCGYLIDARPVCTAESDCAASPNAPHCEVGAGICVECFTSEHCASDEVEKYCDVETFRCTSCLTNNNCASGVCLPNGVCGDDSNVAYVDPATGADNALCASAAPCKTIAAALATKKPYVKLTGAISEAVAIGMQTKVTFFGEPGATWTRPMTGVVLAITAASDVSIFDVTIIGMGEKGITVDMNSTLNLTRVIVTGCNAHDKRAIEVKNATLIMSRSTVAANSGGGILADANAIYQITNSFIFLNGADDSAVGGASLLPTGNTQFLRFEFNTVIDNRAKAIAGGVQCASTIATPNNIVARNYSAGLTVHTAVASTQTGGSCDFAQSQQASDLEQFAFVMPDGGRASDFHLTAGSIAIDRGVTSDLKHDVDGDLRPLGTKPDVGADEYKQ